MGPISTDELHLFHKTHREVFCFLVFRLHRDMTQSLLVMALWIWLEHNGYPNFSHKVMDLSPASINDLVDEAVSCLKCLERENFATPNDGGLPSTKSLTQKGISLRIFKEKRYTIIAGIKSVLKNICARIFGDVLQIIIRSKNINRGRTSRGNMSDKALTIPGFPHPLFGAFNINPPDTTMNLDLFDLRIWMKGPCDDVSTDDKSMFLTFSRGFPVSEGEVIKLFKRSYGDCVENLSMGNTSVQDQSLFAIMVLKNVGTVDQILNGKHVAKLQINRKHIWARKYERRD
ncbi:hypothetical protein PHAVU_002G099200 [Phaseolus vulgaris]|uniref:RRM domain-containing protein n=1 Tax=Phaseolus vulgaris TaxID=3885 RepID=V7CKB1_PHAVU|nr:hypothetical protein PHAVU_002G099200g [Phaseolus vulgaris]ESW29788.1 hypothetical protein PHAVU_002G099200g [Phaseolus vulgaris]